MVYFYNPLDVNKDGGNVINDGISYNIRNSESIKEQIILALDRYDFDNDMSPMQILEYLLNIYGYKLNELIIADEHELLDEISMRQC
jgi:ABC-type multidrug transport system ATPase subunit